MGDEIERRFFDAEDFCTFRERLDAETELLRQTFERNTFSSRGDVAGFELEAWLIDHAGDPSPQNEAYLKQLNNPLVVPELAAFNIEINGSPTSLSGRVFSRLHDELSGTWEQCSNLAREMGNSLVIIGILPTLNEAMLCSRNMSDLVRYRSLNDRVLALRDGRPIRVNIEGEPSLSISHSDVMLEAAATSFQIHLQCRPENAVRDFNASQVASAPIIAAAANSPFLFGHELWDETRIPLFEQSVNVGPNESPRVSFGRDYVHESLFEIFEQNQQEHQILLPFVQDSEPNQFSHLRFQNGTLWRWNRPLIGFDFDGQIHLRIEHRVVPAGPTIKDCIANSAFYFGLVRGFGLEAEPVEARLPFVQARNNFYNCARYGLNAQVIWPATDGHREWPVRTLILEKLLPMARQGLQSQSIPESEIDEYLGIIEARVESTQNGAQWQRRWVNQHGRDLHEMIKTYQTLQQQNQPVHTWPL